MIRGLKKTQGIAVALLFCINMIAQNTNVDSLLSVVKMNKEDTSMVKALNNLGSHYMVVSDYPESEKLTNRALELSKKLNYRYGISTALNNLGILYDYKGDYTRSIEYHNQSLAIRKEINDTEGISSSYNNLAIVYEYLGKFPEALKFQYEALLLNEKTGNKYGVGVCNINMGSVYSQLKKQKEAMDCYQKALQIFTALKADDGIAYAEAGIGMIYLYQSNVEEAIRHNEISKQKFEAIGDKQNVAACMVNMGQIYTNTGNLNEAEKNFTEALNITTSLGDKRNISFSHLGLAHVYIFKKQFADSKKHVEAAINISNEIGCIECQKDNFLMYAQLDSAQGNFKNAFENYKKHKLYSDSLIGIEKEKKVLQNQMQYEFDKKTAADSIRNVEQLKQKEVAHQQEIKTQQAYTYGGIIGFVLMLIVAGVSFKAYKQKQKANRIIALQKDLVEQKQIEILSSIQYAKRIQQSLFPTEVYIEKHLKR